MKVKVSKTVKKAFGKCWKQEVSLLVEAASLVPDQSKGKGMSFISPAQMWINIKVGKRGATITAQPEFLPELEECEVRLEDES